MNESEQTLRVDAPYSVYHGCTGVVIDRTPRGDIKLALTEPPEGWPANTWFRPEEVAEALEASRGS